MPDRMRFLLAGANPGIPAGNAVSTQVLLDALSAFGDVDLLSHAVAILPRLHRDQFEKTTQYRIGAFPLFVHGEGFVGGVIHAREFRNREYSLAWAVNSRYASALAAARLPYAIWEATTIRDELAATSARETRSAGRGSGVGTALHKLSLPINERLEGRLYAGSRATMAMSEYCRERIIVRHPEIAANVGVLLHPPARTFLDALERTRTKLTREWDRVHAPRLLCVGRLDDPRKNVDLLLDACAQLRATCPQLELTLVGASTDTWQRSRAEVLARAGATIRGVIDVNELVRAYLLHDLLVVPSRQEGFGIVVAEALHAGLPVVSTTCGGPEAILTSSEGGVVVANTATALADAVRSLIGDQDRLKLASRLGVQYARANLSTAAFERSVADVIEHTVSATSVRRVTPPVSRIPARMS